MGWIILICTVTVIFVCTWLENRAMYPGGHDEKEEKVVHKRNWIDRIASICKILVGVYVVIIIIALIVGHYTGD